jgi:hypothetical protein
VLVSWIDAAVGDDDLPTLNITVPGINSRGTDMFNDITAVQQLGTTYRISLKAEQPQVPRSARTVRDIIQNGLDSDADPPGTKNFFVDGASDPKLARILRDISREKHATVTLDMDLINLGEKNWGEQTDQVARIVGRIADERTHVFPNSRNSILAHSAGTVALSKVIDGGYGAFFQTKIAASPMTWQLSPDVFILQVNDDTPSRPTGAWVSPGGDATSNADGWLSRGNKVIRVSGRGLDFQPSYLNPLLRDIPILNRNIFNQAVNQHPRSHRLQAYDREVEVYLPVEGSGAGVPSPMRPERIRLENVNPQKIIRTLSAHLDSTTPTKFDELRSALQQLEPPKGGGIALRATASVTIEPSSITSAKWDPDSARIRLLDAVGREMWQLPSMPPDIATVAYRAVFSTRAADPELSIGVPLDEGRQNARAGFHPVYYRGPIADTRVGLILLNADIALGDIAYGSSLKLRDYGLDQVPGFHSLPEMYPAKYAEAARQNQLLGDNERIVIDALPTQLVAASNRVLTYAPEQQELAVRFGRTTPVERAFADLFNRHYADILVRIPALKELVECSRVISVFKWLKANNIPLSSAPNDKLELVLTPHQTPARQRARLEDLVFVAPLVWFEDDGPRRVFPNSDSFTEIAYERGQIAAVNRYDGRILRVFRDDLQVPIGIELADGGAAVFTVSQDGGSRLNTNVTLQKDAKRLIGFTAQSDNRVVPENDRWGLVKMLATAFIAAP